MANLTISPTIVKVLQVVKLNKSVTPTEINDHVGDGDYAAKHVWYLGKLGFTVTKQKDGRKIASYTLIAEPANAEAIRNTVHGAARKTVTKSKKSAPLIVSNAVNVSPKIKAPKKASSNKSVADIKAANLAKLKAVGDRFKSEKSELEILNDTPSATSFSIDGDWDSVEGLDLQKLRLYFIFQMSCILQPMSPVFLPIHRIPPISSN